MVKDYPGTGPFMFDEFSDQEFLKLKKNPNYWNPDLPYLDGIHMLHLNAWVPEMGAALLAGRVDYARAIEPGSFKKAIEHPEIETAQYPQHVIFAMWMNNAREPMNDARVRRGDALGPGPGGHQAGHEGHLPGSLRCWLYFPVQPRTRHLRRSCCKGLPTAIPRTRTLRRRSVC